ncbi:MAG: NAD-dependent deacylase [Anaerolineae bacterium]|nr:NAD-dependent deacylase [Anaerolineae bacterium]NUQ02762.1 NAD-dependent deacylase [Anaerolineae bacterium]
MVYDVVAVDRVVELLRTARHAIAFTGAGISTPSGIPDFRSPNSGLWENVNPLEVASIFGFRQNPRAFYDWVYPLVHLTMLAQPNPAHLALARLESMGILKAIITQNIDMLHTRAGSQVVHELHGHMREATCTHCFRVFPGEALIRKFLEDHIPPRCPQCGHIVKPNVILYGEQLPYREMQASREAAGSADLMVIVGSSLEVAPASDLPLIALRARARLVIINLSSTHLDSRAAVHLTADAAEVLPEIVRRLEGIA